MVFLSNLFSLIALGLLYFQSYNIINDVQVSPNSADYLLLSLSAIFTAKVILGIKAALDGQNSSQGPIM